MSIEGIVALIGLFGSIFGFFYLFFTTRHRERIALIENKQTAEVFNRSPVRKIRSLNIAYWTLKLGLLVVGIAVGLLVALIVNSNVTHRLHEGVGVVFFSCILLFGGIGLIFDFFIEKKAFRRAEREQEKDNIA
jgi:hypothetical protein